MTSTIRSLTALTVATLVAGSWTTRGWSADPTPGTDAIARSARSLLAESLQSEEEAKRMMALRAAASVPDPAIADTVRPTALSHDRYERSLALDVLATADPKGSRAEFLAALDSPYRTVRLRGLLALAAVRDPALADRFAQTLSTDPDPDLRALAARALGSTGGADVRPPLYAALDDSAEVVRRAAVTALAALADEVLAAELERRLAQAPARERAGVISLIAVVAEPRLVTTLAPYLEDPDSRVRIAAAAAILTILSREPMDR